MFGQRKVPKRIALATTAILALALAIVGGFASASAADPVSVAAKVSAEGNITVVDISITNNTKDLIRFDVIATMPQSGKLVYAFPTPYMYDGKTVIWSNPRGVGAGKTAVGFQYKIEGAAGKINVRVDYYGASVGTASTDWIAVGGGTADSTGAVRATKPPVPSLAIVPVPANAADVNAIKATLPSTDTVVAMGTTGLPNVSVGVPVTLKATSTDPAAPARTFAWTLSGPSKSKAVLDKKDAPVVKFTPDVPGVYKVDVVIGNEAGSAPMQSLQISAGTYIGVERGNCKSCHTSEANEWAKTNHAIIFKREIDGGADPATSHYREACLRCHTTGYYIGVENGGFADLQAKTGWQFPPLESIQSGKGNWDAVPAQLKALANIQCESCHGPAFAHVTSKAPMAVSLDEGVCNVCHNGGGTHVKGAELANSKHADATSRAWSYPTGPSRQACVRCHSGNGYISFLANPTEQASWDNSPQNVTCAVCHDPHSDANKFQLRIAGKPVEAVGIDKDFGLSATCVECHNARTKAGDAVKGSTPHYSAAAEMLSAAGGVDYGQQILDSPHGLVVGSAPVTDPADPEGKAKLFGGAVPGPCVVCHMWPTPADSKDPYRFKVGGHSFNVVSPDGKFQYTAACQTCHSGIKDFNIPAKADYDGNGKVEGVQDEVAGLLKVLQKAIADSGIPPQEAHPYFDPAAKAKANDKQNNAIYNYLFVRGLPGSNGRAAAIHNFKRSVMLLQASYRDLTGTDVPNATILK